MTRISRSVSDPSHSAIIAGISLGDGGLTEEQEELLTNIQPLTEDALVSKETTDTMADFQLAIDEIPSDLGGFELELVLLDGNHAVDSELDLSRFYNGKISLRAENELTEASELQTSTLIFNSAYNINMVNSEVNLTISSLALVVDLGNSVFFNIDGNNVVTSKFNRYDTTSSSDDIWCIFASGARVSSTDDTFSGSATNQSVFVDLARGADEDRGGTVTIINSKVAAGGYKFSYIATGMGVVYIGANNEGFYDNADSDAIIYNQPDSITYAALEGIKLNSVSGIEYDEITVDAPLTMVLDSVSAPVIGGNAWGVIIADGTNIPDITDFVAFDSVAYENTALAENHWAAFYKNGVAYWKWHQIPS